MEGWAGNYYFVAGSATFGQSLSLNMKENLMSNLYESCRRMTNNNIVTKSHG
jgi:hypothetical protein